MKTACTPRIAIAAMALALAHGILAQDPAPPPAAPAAAPAEVSPPAAPAAAPAPAPAAAPETFREQVIYIPYEDLRKTFEKAGRGVFLPYEEFQRLWQAARSASARPPDARPPVDNLISEVAAEAVVARDVVRVTAKVRVELLKEGWHQVPLRLGDAAIASATLGTAPARLVPAKGGCALLVEHAGPAPEVAELTLEFAKAYTRSPGRNAVSFEAPVTPVSRWDIRIPEPGVKVDVQPLLAATEVPAAQGVTETHVQAFVGATPTVRIEWTPRAEGARGLTALASVQADTRVTLDEGVARTRVELAYTVSRADLPQLQVEVPADQKIVNVFDPNVREWSVAAAGANQRITVLLFEPARERQALVLEMERFGAEAEVAVPAVRALDVGRQQGTVAVRVGAGLRAEPVRREGLLQLDAAELPAGPAAGTWDFAYRYAALPFELTLRVEKILPRVVAETLVEAHLQPEELTVDVRSVLDVQRAGVFQFLFAVPPEWEVRSVRGETVENATPAEVDNHHRLDGQPGTLAVTLSRQALGRVAVGLQLARRLSEPDLLTPSGKAAVVPVPIPRADPGSVFRETGRLVVYGPESLRFTPRDPKGLRPIPQADALQGFPPVQPPAGERAVLAFAFAEEAASLNIEAERRKPHVTVRQLLSVRIESGVARFEATFFADVLYSGIRGVRVDLPAALTDQVRVLGGFRHETLDNPADLGGLPEGYAAWRLSGEAELLGAVAIPMVWEQKLEKLDVGASVEIPVPRLIPQGVDRAWGQILLAKAESIEVTPAETRSGLRAIDPQHDLMPGAAGSDVARAFEFVGDWSLTLRATRYQAKDVKATSIERALVHAVATRSGVTSVQAVYRMRSARQRLTVRLPGQVEFDTQPLHIDGRPVPLEQGAGNEYHIPLTGQAQNAPFLVELRYTVRGQGLRFECPAFPQEPAIQRVYLSVFLPQELAYLGSTGPWTDELVWVIRGFTSQPRANRSAGDLYRWVSEGLSVDQGALASFATDGRHLLYSTLRPPPGEAGALAVRAVRAAVLQAVVIVLGLAAGLALLPAGLVRRAQAIGAAAVAVLLLAVFAPSLTRALVTNAAVAAALIVVIVWALWYLAVTRPRDPLVRERRRRREEARRREAEARGARAAAAAAAPPPVPPAPPGPPAEGGNQDAGKDNG